MKIFLILFVALIRVEANNWKLVWSEEFEGQEGQELSGFSNSYASRKCQGSNCVECIKPMSAWPINGTLTVTDAQQDKSNLSWIESSWLIKKDFKYGKYEIRAAQPKRDQIWTDMFLVNPEKDNTAQFHLGKYYQQANIEQQISINKNSQRMQISLTESLNDFHIYSIEVNETHVIWKFDGKQTWYQNITGVIKNEPDFLLIIGYNVGDLFDETIDFKNADKIEGSECSSFIVDYIRYFQSTNQEVSEDNLSKNSVTSSDVCNSIKYYLSFLSSKEN